MSESNVVVVKNGKLLPILVCALAVLIATLIIAGYYAFKALRDENVKLRDEVVEFKKLTDSLVRSSTKWATKEDLDAQLKDLMTKEDLASLRSDLSKLGSELTAVGRTVGSLGRKVASLEKSDREGFASTQPVDRCAADGRPIDMYGYTQKPQFKILSDAKLAPLAEVQFDASKDKPWGYEVFKRDYQVVTAVGKKDDGQMTFHHALSYTVPDKDKDKRYSIDVLSSDFLQTPPKSKMFWLNPIVDVNAFAGGRVLGFADGRGRPDDLLAFGADVGLSLSSYGETKVDSWFRFFRFGAGYDAERQAGHFSFAPVAFNVGKPLPLITNLYITPQVAIDTAGGLSVNIGIGPQF